MGGRSSLLVLALGLFHRRNVGSRGREGSSIGNARTSTRSGGTGRFLGRRTLPTPPGPLPGHSGASGVVADLEVVG